ncbi:MAG: phosphoribosylglycinamide formyltransferase [Actinobacteria bacterium]|nr:phosphoribosylglycinamide formyltransferase [Actinomycetota bacterium]
MTAQVAVLASGSGSILSAILRAGIPVAVVVSDRKCTALCVGEQAGIPVELVERRSFGSDFDRDAYTDQVVEALSRYEISIVAMAGFGTILGSAVHKAYPQRILNTHPALLPAFKGWHAVADALAAGVKVTGCTVHLATLEVDEGPILAQEAVQVLDGDSVETLHERIKQVERRIYPDTIMRMLRSGAGGAASKGEAAK